jgi:hypothetical protein
MSDVIVTEATYRAVHSRGAEESGIGESMPPHVKREHRDGHGRRCTEFVATCSTDEYADRIAALLQGATPPLRWTRTPPPLPASSAWYWCRYRDSPPQIVCVDADGENLYFQGDGWGGRAPLVNPEDWLWSDRPIPEPIPTPGEGPASGGDL